VCIVQLLRVGVSVFRYVAVSAATCWLITIDKNIRGRGHRQSDSQVLALALYFLCCLTIVINVLQYGRFCVPVMYMNLSIIYVCLIKSILRNSQQ